LSAAVVGGQIERHPSPGTRKNAQGSAYRSCACCTGGVKSKLKRYKSYKVEKKNSLPPL
jgi:hypothetical protein